MPDSEKKISRTESRLKSNHICKDCGCFVDVPRDGRCNICIEKAYTIDKKANESPKSSPKINSKPKKKRKISKKAAMRANGKRSAKMHSDPNREYNIPTHNLTQEQAIQYHRMYVRQADQETVSGYLPKNMRIDSRGVIRFKKGQAPQTLANLKPNHARLRDFPQDSYTSKAQQEKRNAQEASSLGNSIYKYINTNSNHGKKLAKTLREFYQEKLNQTGTIYLGSGQDQKKITAKWGEILVEMQLYMLKKLIKRPDSYDLASKILTDLRLNAGEIPAQQVNIDEKQSHYHEHTFPELVEAATAVLERQHALKKPDIKAENANFEILPSNGKDTNPNKDNDLQEK